MLQTLQYVNLLHHFPLSTLFFDLIFVSRLNRYKLPRQSMQAEIDLAEGSLAKYLAHFVQLNASLGHLLKLGEAISDYLC